MPTSAHPMQADIFEVLLAGKVLRAHDLAGARNLPLVGGERGPGSRRGSSQTRAMSEFGSMGRHVGRQRWTQRFQLSIMHA